MVCNKQKKKIVKVVFLSPPPLFFFLSRACTILKFPCQGSNQSCSCQPTPQPQQCQIHNPLIRARAQMLVIMDTSWVCLLLSHNRNSLKVLFLISKKKINYLVNRINEQTLVKIYNAKVSISYHNKGEQLFNLLREKDFITENKRRAHQI